LKICADENDIYIEAIRLGLILSIISDAILSSFLEKKNFFGDLPQRMEKIEITRRLFAIEAQRHNVSQRGFTLSSQGSKGAIILPRIHELFCHKDSKTQRFTKNLRAKLGK
jgi:hypothetical protein